MKIKLPTFKRRVPKPVPAHGKIEFTAIGDQRIRRTTTGVVLSIAAFAGYISYRHAYELAVNHGEGAASAWALPLTIDGLIFSASMVILRANRHGAHVPKMAWVAMALGILATLGANVAHGVPYGIVGMLTAAWPAIALVVSFEMLMRLFKPLRAMETADEPEAVRTVEPVAVEPELAVQARVTAPRPKAIPAPRPATSEAADRPTDSDRYKIGVDAYVKSLLGPGRPLSQRDLAAIMGMKNRVLAAQVISDVQASEAIKGQEQGSEINNAVYSTA